MLVGMVQPWQLKAATTNVCAFSEVRDSRAHCVKDAPLLTSPSNPIQTLDLENIRQCQ